MRRTDARSTDPNIVSYERLRGLEAESAALLRLCLEAGLDPVQGRAKYVEGGEWGVKVQRDDQVSLLGRQIREAQLWFVLRL